MIEKNKTGNFTHNVILFVQPLLLWKRNKYYIFWLCVRNLSYPAIKAHPPYFIVIFDLSCSTVYFCIISLAIPFSKNVIGNKMCILYYLQNSSEILLILRRMQLDITINVHRSSCKWALFLSDVNKIWIFSTDFRKILKCKIS